jgi:hypothetical protein
MHCQVIPCTGLFDMGLTSAEGQKLECFKWATNNIFITIMNPIMLQSQANILSYLGSVCVFREY